MKPEYRKGSEARKNFETTMSKLFRVPKGEASKPKPKPRWVTGEYFYHMRRRAPNPAARDAQLQDRLLDACARFSAVALPE